MKGKNRRNGEISLTNQGGIVLITVIIIFTFLAALGLNLITFLLSQESYIQVQLDRLGALYLAEAAISRSIYELRMDIDFDGDGIGNIPPTKLGAGTCWARHNFSTSTITATGEVNRVKRTVQIKYSAL